MVVGDDVGGVEGHSGPGAGLKEPAVLGGANFNGNHAGDHSGAHRGGIEAAGHWDGLFCRDRRLTRRRLFGDCRLADDDGCRLLHQDGGAGTEDGPDEECGCHERNDPPAAALRGAGLR